MQPLLQHIVMDTWIPLLVDGLVTYQGRDDGIYVLGIDRFIGLRSLRQL